MSILLSHVYVFNNLFWHVSILYACVEKLEVAGKEVPPRQVMCTATDWRKTHGNLLYCKKGTGGVKGGIWSAQGNKFSRKIKFHTCEMLWSFLESTKPDKHHLHPHLRPGERHFAHGYISQIKVFTHLNTNAFQFPIFLVKTETDPDELLPHTQTTRLSHTFTYTLWWGMLWWFIDKHKQHLLHKHQFGTGSKPYLHTS